MKRLLVAGLVLALPLTASAATLFSDNMDAASAANWTKIDGGAADSLATFGYDYSADGIPEAPSTTGGNATSGVKLEANLSAGALDVFTLVPNGQNFTGTHQLRFDAWMNFNTDVAGAGTTEFLGGGVGHNGAAADLISGAQLVATGDGGSSNDYRAFKSSTGLASDQFFIPDPAMVGGSHNGNIPYHTNYLPAVAPPVDQLQGGTGVAGSPGFQWVTFIFTAINQGGINKVRIAIQKPGSGVHPLVNIQCNDTSDGSTGCTSEGNISLVYADFFSSVAPDPALQFGIIDNVTVTDVPEPASLALLGLGGLVVLRRRR